MLKFLAVAIVAVLSIAAVILTEAEAWSQAYPETISGVIKVIDAQEITIETAPGAQIVVDISAAKAGDHIGTPIAVDRHVVALGRHQGDKFIAAALHKGLTQ